MQAADEALWWRIAESVRAAAVDGGREVIQVGPFAALLDPSSDVLWFNYAVPTEPLGDAAGVAVALAQLRRVFTEHGRVPRFEYIEGLWPTLAPALEEAGLALQGRQPLLLCTPAELRPLRAPRVEVQVLDGDDEAALSLYLGVQHAGFEETDEIAASDPESVARLRRQIQGGHLRCALARLDGTPAGAGVTVAHGGVAELAGVATRPAQRRRGVAATLSSALVRDHFARGGTLAWLSAADAAAQAVYERIGFRLAGTQLNYVQAS